MQLIVTSYNQLEYLPLSVFCTLPAPFLAGNRHLKSVENLNEICLCSLPFLPPCLQFGSEWLARNQERDLMLIRGQALVCTFEAQLLSPCMLPAVIMLLSSRIKCSILESSTLQWAELMVSLYRADQVAAPLKYLLMESLAKAVS